MVKKKNAGTQLCKIFFFKTKDNIPKKFRLFSNILYKYFYLMKKKLLIIGRRGFVGSNLIKFLKKYMNLTTSDFEKFISDNQIYNKKYDYIINCSSNKSFVNKKYSLKHDNDFLIANKIAHSQTKLIMFSTRKIYEPKLNIKENDLKNPKCNYSKNKLISENLVKKTLKNKSLILRVGNVIGLPVINERKIHKTFVDIFFDKAKSGIVYKNPYIYKDFLPISKLNRIIFALIRKNVFGTYNVSSGKKIYINEIVNWLNFYNKKKITKIFPKKSFNNDNFTLNNTKLMNKIKIKNSSNDLKNECIKISKSFFNKK